MKKKWTALLLAMLLTLSVLTGCGSGERALPTVDGAPSNMLVIFSVKFSSAYQPVNS